MKRNHLAALLGGVLFMAGFVLATGVDENLTQAVCVLILMGGALVCFGYAEQHDNAAGAKDTESINLKKAA